MTQSLYDFKVTSANGKPLSLSEFNNKVVLIVNVASKCGFTPQYEGLENLYKKYQQRGVEIIGFPCNQFGQQEPGSNEEIQEFCKMNYGVSFPIMAKIDVNGDKADPLYGWLKSTAPGLLGIEAIKWNFTKFLIGKDGQVVARYAPTTEPHKMENDIEKILENF